jgi:hypothetical protein
MENFSPFKIIKLQDVELMSILENYSNYTFPTILYTYAESNRRKLVQSVMVLKNIEEFEKKYLEFDNYDINESILKWCEKEGAKSYDELYMSFTGQIAIKADDKKNPKPKRREVNPEYIIAAGRSLKSVVIVAIVMIICSIIGYIVADNLTDIESIRNIYYSIGAVGLIAWIIILIKLYSAGDNLEDAVIYR